MKKKKSRVLRLARPSSKGVLLRSRRAKARKRLVRKGLVRKVRRGRTGKHVRYGKGKKGFLLRRKRRIRRRALRKAAVIQPPVNVVPVAVPPPAVKVIPLPPELGVPPEMQPGDAFQQGYSEAYNVGFDTGFAKGFEDGHKLEFS